ncbi:hypothetical protein UlMin_005547 [Ulmus minor]
MAVDRRTSLLVLLLMAFLPLAFSGRYLVVSRAHSHETLMKGPWFKYGDPIPLFANKVNQLEKTCMQYPYFDYPFCPPGEKSVSQKKSLAEVLAGDCFTNTQYKLKFKVSSLQNVLCEKTLTRKEVRKFRKAVRDSFEYQMSYNNIFFRGMVGKIDEKIPSDPRYYLVRNINFYPQYYHNQVRAIDVVDDFDSAVDITEDAEIKVNFTYSVLWKEYKPQKLDNSSLQDSQPAQENGIWELAWSVHFWASNFLIWFGVLFVFLVPYWRSYLKRRPYFHGDEHSQKKDISPYIHGDTCSCPPYTFFLGAVIGTGTQLFIMLCIFIYFAFKGIMHPCNLKAIFSQIFQTYCYSSIFAAYKTNAFHGSFSLISWRESIYLTGAIYFIPFFFLITLALNFLATAKFVIPFAPELGFIAQDLVIWAFLTCIFLSVGSTIAHFTRSRQKVLCPTRKLSRENHQQSLFLKTPVQMLLGGLIPFLILLPEMDNIYATLWNKKICGAVDTILYSFIYLITLTVPISVGFSHYEFYKQDYQWCWRSVFRGGSTAIYMFFYGFYFFSRTHIEQTLLVQLLCYNACIFYALFLILGTASFYASSLIFHYAYQLQKDE